MSKTIRVIDLLNKIANGEEVPKKIKILGLEFEWFEGCYRTCDTLKKYLSDCWRLDNILNDTVEIIEEQEKIDIQSIEELDENFTYIENHSSGLGIEKVLNKAEIELVNKINKLVQAVKQLDKKIKEKE